MKFKIALLAAAAVVAMVLVAPVGAEHPEGDPVESVDVFLKGCRKGDSVAFEVDSPHDDGTATAVGTVEYPRGALETTLTIPEGYTTTDVLIATCSKGSVAASLGGSANFCGGDPGLGDYAAIASQGNRFCLKVTATS